MMRTQTSGVHRGIGASALGIAVNMALALVKITTGVVGSSYALIADGIESAADIVSSIVVWGGLRLSVRPADAGHPYGHGKAESLAGLVVAAALLGAAGLIAYQSIQEIRAPHSTPAWFTLPVLLLVVVVKEALSRYVLQIGEDLESTAVKGDAWHHRSDALTSAAAAVGISIALIGGKGYEEADDWAALLACGVIVFNGVRLFRGVLAELMDAAAPARLVEAVRELARGIPGVVMTEKCRVRKYGTGYIVDLHIVVDGETTVREGHLIGHRVKDALCASPLRIVDALIHIEPSGEAAAPAADAQGMPRPIPKG